MVHLQGPFSTSPPLSDNRATLGPKTTTYNTSHTSRPQHIANLAVHTTRHNLAMGVRLVHLESHWHTAAEREPNASRTASVNRRYQFGINTTKPCVYSYDILASTYSEVMV